MSVMAIFANYPAGLLNFRPTVIPVGGCGLSPHRIVFPRT